jgi:hypothetical protein
VTMHAVKTTMRGVVATYRSRGHQSGAPATSPTYSISATTMFEHAVLARRRLSTRRTAAPRDRLSARDDVARAVCRYFLLSMRSRVDGRGFNRHACRTHRVSTISARRSHRVSASGALDDLAEAESVLWMWDGGTAAHILAALCDVMAGRYPMSR